MANSKSDQEGPIPLQLNTHLDPGVYKHLNDGRLVDAVTRKKITSHTSLVALYDFGDPQVDGTLLQNLTGITAPAVLCKLSDSDDKQYPPTLNGKYQLKVTYDKLIIAPVIRLECQFMRAAGVKSSAYLTLILEFHFNDFDGPETALQDYMHLEENGILTFRAKRATCSGFNNASRFSALMGSEEEEVIKLLRSYLQPEEVKEMKLELHEEFLSSSQKAELRQVRSRLPGGNKQLLSSIGITEYNAFGPDSNWFYSAQGSLRKPAQVLEGAAPHPMVPLAGPDTFSTKKEAAVQLACGASISNEEELQALRLWAKPLHLGKLYNYGNFPVVGVKFSQFGRLGSATAEIHYRLPRTLSTRMTFTVPNTRNLICVAGFLMSDVSALPKHDAHFMISSHPLRYFSDQVPDLLDDHAKEFGIKFDPHTNNSTFCSQLETVAQLQEKRNTRWTDILLNQAHDAIPDIDLTEHQDPTAALEAYLWLRNWMEWNAEQMQVIQGIKKAKGGVLIVMGPAGTGKTLLQEALAIFFYKLGFHILALAPANSNANHLAKQMHKIAEDVQVELRRLYPSSKEMGVEKVNERQTAERKAGYQAGSSLSFSELLIALEELDHRGFFNNPYGVVEQVIDIAENHKLELFRRLKDEHGSAKDIENVWEVLRGFIASYRAGTFDPRKTGEARRFRMAYTACKGHVIGLCRFMITTTGNVRAGEMQEHWFCPEEEYGVPRKGVIVFVDEAAKDVEVNVWSGVVCKKWAGWVKGFFMFGDDKQLKPTNMSSKSDAVFNPFNERIDNPLPCRLIREGFPYFRLREQRRMNEQIAAFANHEIYDNELRNGPGTNVRLGELKFGLRTVLADIIATNGLAGSGIHCTRYLDHATSADVRLHYIQVKGRRKVHPAKKSVVVEEHVDVFFEKILPPLQAFFMNRNEKLEDNLMIICAYGYAVEMYTERIKGVLRADPQLTTADMPRVLTVDASQGQESFMVIFDGSFQKGDQIGFMTDMGRANVAITRAKEVFWIIGGHLQNRFRGSNIENPDGNLFTRYRKYLGEKNQVHKF